MKISTYHTIVRYSAVYDILATLPFAIPIFASFYLSQLGSIQSALGFSGIIPNFEPLHLFFINLLGAIVMVWSAYRIRHTQSILGFYDGIARFLFAGLMLFYLVNYQVAGIVWLFFVPELSWGIIQIVGYSKIDAGRSDEALR